MATPIPPSSSATSSRLSALATQPPAPIAEALDSMRQTNLFPLLFSAWFTERVYREEISDYRDRLLVDRDEVRVVKAVRSAARRLKKAIAAAEVKDKSAAVESKFCPLTKLPLSNEVLIELNHLNCRMRRDGRRLLRRSELAPPGGRRRAHLGPLRPLLVHD